MPAVWDGEALAAILQPSISAQVQQVRTVRVVLDGHWRGVWAVSCDCETTWNGVGTLDGLADVPTPAQAIAEVVAHRYLEHRADRVEVTFTERFSKWLARYWDALNRADSAASTR